MPKKETNVMKNITTGTGRRKTSVASIFIKEEKGDFLVNGKNITEYFPLEKDTVVWTKPFYILGIAHPSSKYSATIKVSGSGKYGQLEAVRHAISWALAKMNAEWATSLRKQGLLTRDSRMVERKKYNHHKARKATQYSKR